MGTLVGLFLWANAFLYLVLGLWCGFAPSSTSESVGFSLSGVKGYAEFIAVYGGLEAGVGLFFLLAALRPHLQEAALLFSVCMYGGIVIFRTGAMLKSGWNIGNGWIFYSLEIAMFLGAAWLLMPRNS